MKQLVRALGITAVILTVITLGLFAVWGTGPALLELAWFNAFALTFQALTSMAVSYLVFGRFRVLGDATSYWVGIAFTVYGTALVMYVLVWPGLLPDGSAFLGRLVGTSGWFTVLLTMGLWVFLQIAARPAARVPALSWGWAAALSMAATVAAGALMILFEAYLPPLVREDDSFTALLTTLYLGEIALFAAGVWLAVRVARSSGDPLLALCAFLQMTLAFVLVWAVLSSSRYGLWWYLGRVALTAGALVVLFGMLADHVRLLRREREKTRELTALAGELRAAEARLLESYAELQRVNRELKQEDERKNEFLAVLSHELRNPLATISNVLQVLDQQTSKQHDPQETTLRAMALRQARHMSRLLDDLLDVARIGGGRIRLHADRVDLSALVEEAVEALRPQLEARSHTLKLSLMPGIDVTGDAVRLTQAVTNLLHNAAKYTPAEGRVEVSVGQADGAAVVRVHDNGIGIEPERLESIFELFVQGESSLDRQGSGLGIGLTLTRSLIEMHGGSVEVRSAGANQGSEFVVRLPLASHSSSPPMHPPASAHSAPARRVLLVEDDADAGEAMRSLLTNLGHEVLLAPSGEAALQGAGAFRPDVILLDIGLPGMDGYETARRMRERPDLAAPTLVALTGYGQRDDRAQARAAGFDEHLVKPVDVEALKQVLSRARGRNG